jgi:dCMP deaminase
MYDASARNFLSTRAGSKAEENFPVRRLEHMKRPSWEEYFMDITHMVKSRSTCLRRHIGAIIVKDKNILTTGYNGAPSGTQHCLDVGCLREQMNVPSGERHELCRALHAEQNAIIQAAKHGISIEGADLYCTNLPCLICSKMIINAGIRRIYYEGDYPDHLSREMLAEAGVELIHWEENEGR